MQMPCGSISGLYTPKQKLPDFYIVVLTYLEGYSKYPLLLRQTHAHAEVAVAHAYKINFQFSDLQACTNCMGC